MNAAARLRILIVENDAGVLRAIQRLIAVEGHLPTPAVTGGAALELLAAGEYEAILCSTRLPDLDGPALYEEVERRWPHLVARFLFMTGDPEWARGAWASFFARTRVPVILRPFDKAVLLAAIGAPPA